MTKWQRKSKKKKSGGLRRGNRKKKKFERARDYFPAHIDEPRKKILRTVGAGKKIVLLSTDVANVVKNGKAQKTKILSVLENRADPHFVRRNIITKGAIIETELGKAVVTSRPGQHGVVNARVIE